VSPQSLDHSGNEQCRNAADYQQSLPHAFFPRQATPGKLPLWAP
jgi:hypothetical protein